MRKDWQDIYNVYPAWFEEMEWGFECGIGWHDIIKELVQAIYDHLKEKEWDLNAFRIAQIKEKYGSLRFYFYYGDDYIYDLVSKYEYISENTCEICGEPGEIKDIGWHWYQCLCEKHFEERTKSNQ